MSTTPVLPPMDVAGRTPKLRAAFDDAGIDALLVTSLPNIRYLTGFTGSSAFLLVTDDDLVFITDGRYKFQAAEQLDAAGVTAQIEITGTDHATILQAASAGAARVGLEADQVTWAQQRAWSAKWFASQEVVPTEEMVTTLRLVKDAGEIARITRAAAIADEAFAAVRPMLATRPTEKQFSMALDAEMRNRGAEDVSFETIVAAGPNAAKPHARPSDRQISDGDLLVCDFGALYEGYHSDMTRSFAVGTISETQQRMLDVVTEAQAAGRAMVGPGVSAADIDQACREVIEAAGWGDAFLHSTGHGVGLDIHESPRVSGISDATIVPGFVITVEPGVYLPEHGGVRVEDLLVVTDDGADVLTTTPRDNALA